MVKLRKGLLVVLLSLLLAGFVLAQTNNADQREFIRRGNAKYAKAEYDSAIADYLRVSPASGEIYAQALHNIGVCYYELWRTEDAIAMYRKAIEASEGNYSKAFYSMGVALEDLKQWSEAKKAYQHAVEKPGDRQAAAYFKLGVIAASENDWETAAGFFKKAISRSDDQFPSSHNNLGVMLARTGRLREAEREFEIALYQARGAHVEARYNLELCRSLLLAPTRTLLVSDLQMKEEN